MTFLPLSFYMTAAVQKKKKVSVYIYIYKRRDRKKKREKQQEGTSKMSKENKGMKKIMKQWKARDMERKKREYEMKIAFLLTQSRILVSQIESLKIQLQQSMQMVKSLSAIIERNSLPVQSRMVPLTSQRPIPSPKNTSMYS